MTDVYAPQSSSDARKYVKSFQSDGTAVFEQVGFEELDFSAIFGKVTTSSTQNAIAYGIKGFTLDYDNDSIKVGYPLQCMSLDDPECFMQGVVTLKDTTYSPAYIEVAITIISPVVNTTNNWELSVVPLAGFSINPSATVGISTTSIDASGAGPFTFTTQTGKLFMQQEAIDGTVVCTSLADPKTYLFGRISVVSGTSLVVEKIYSNATAAVSSWSIQLFDGPDTKLPFLAISGLRIEVSEVISDSRITVTAGAVMDSTNAFVLSLDNDVVKYLNSDWAVGTGNGGIVKVLCTGTVTSAGATLTGTGTLFTTELVSQSGDAVFLNDYLNSGGLTSSFFGSVEDGCNVYFASSGISSRITGITNNTSADTYNAVSASASAFYRNGYFVAGVTVFNLWYVVLIRKDTDGSCDIALVTSTQSGEPDLPSGYTRYRVLGMVASHNTDRVDAVQHIYENNYPFAPRDARYVVTSAAGDSRLINERALVSGTSNTIDISVASQVSINRAALTGDVTAPSNSNATTLSSTAITNKTEKVTLVDGDVFLIADSEASFALKKVKKSNIGGAAAFPADMGLITEAATITFDAGTVP